MYLECTNCGRIADEDDFRDSEDEVAICPECLFVDKDDDFEELQPNDGLISLAFRAINEFLKGKPESKELEELRKAKLALGEYIRHFM